MFLLFKVLVLLATFLSIYCLDLNRFESLNHKNGNEKFKRNARNAYIRNLSNIRRNLSQDYLKRGYRKCISLNGKNKILECIEDLRESILKNFYTNKPEQDENIPPDTSSNTNLDKLNSNNFVLNDYSPFEIVKNLKTVLTYGPEYSNNNGDYSTSNKYDHDSSGNYNQEEYYPKRSRSRSKRRSRSRTRSRTRLRSLSRSRTTRRSRSLIRRRNRLRRVFCNDIERRDDSICRSRRRRIRSRTPSRLRYLRL